MQTGRAQVPGTPYVGDYAPCTSMGTDFWTAFENNNNVAATSTYLALNIVTQIPTTVTITVSLSLTNIHTYTYNIAAGGSRIIDISQMRSDGSTGTVTDERGNIGFSSVSIGDRTQCLHITSSAPIAVYAFNTNAATTDATVLYPVTVWGTNYYNLSYRPTNGVFNANELIIANQNNTVITLYNTDGTVNSTQTLSAGHVYITQGTVDFTGKRLTSNNPVAYIAGVQQVYIPIGAVAGDVFDEQMPPTSMWDKQYFVPNVPQFTNPSAAVNNRIRIVSAQNGTVVNYAGASLPAGFSSLGSTGNNQIASGGTLNAGQWVELAINSATNTGGAYITASNPVGVAGYIVGGGISGGTAASAANTGDPDNAVIPGLNQMVQQTTISPFIPGNITTGGSTTLNATGAIHGAIIVSRTATKSSVVMTRGSDPTNKLTGTWIDDPNGSGTSSYYYTFDNTADIGAAFTVSSPGGIFVLAYGLGAYESYYYNAGSGACSLQ